MKSLREVMQEKSEQGLMDYLNNFQRYTPEAIAKAVNELRHRGRTFTQGEYDEINRKIEQRKVAVNEEDFMGSVAPDTIVTDPAAPELYTKGTIVSFSIFMSALFGAAMFASNLKETRRKVLVIGFGSIYCCFIILLFSWMQLGSLPVLKFLRFLFALNFLGGVGLVATFWNRYIGKDTVYRAKSILNPIMMAIAIAILVIVYLT